MTMLIALTILVGIVHSAQICRYSGFKEQPFKEIINPNLRMLLQSKIRAIADTDCTLSYQVNTNDNKKAFYPFRIDSSNSIIYGIVTNALRIGDSDCTLSYQVEKEDNGENFYPFRFDQDQSRFYGIVKKSNGGKLVWIPTNRQTFEIYLDKCYNERAPGSKPPNIPPVLPCSPTRSASTFFRQNTENRF
ncbi:hypothetical protein GCK32_015962 [Trichostrongylus colubriformis]|uniref:Uncharacterized protein n=1 Tax=Trichostrongylus colubriformis TaxID=6319 RepID=A0AAN8FN18_TRICO